MVHAWRVVWERIPTKNKLWRRNILLPSDNTTCTWCGLHKETIKHVLFKCSFSYQVWMDVCKWIGVETVLSSNPSINLFQFSRFWRGKRGRKVTVSIWECVVWILWKGRNAKTFRNEVELRSKMVEEIKSRTWAWLVNKDPRCSRITFSI
ncbi:hypothetical protein ACS0TY_008271 [Phlomoides rotata]